MKTIYTNLYEINRVQQQIIRYIMGWCKEQKVPIPQLNIIAGMTDLKEKTIIHNLIGLVRLGYIRKAEMRHKKHHKTCFVLLRTI